MTRTYPWMPANLDKRMSREALAPPQRSNGSAFRGSRRSEGAMKIAMKRCAVVIGVAGALILTAASSRAAWFSSDTITLGAAVQISGSLANTGRYYRDGYQLTVDKVNEKGGLTVGGSRRLRSLYRRRTGIARTR